MPAIVSHVLRILHGLVDLNAAFYWLFFLYGLFGLRGRPHWLTDALRAPSDLLRFKDDNTSFGQILRAVYPPIQSVLFIAAVGFLAARVPFFPADDGDVVPFIALDAVLYIGYLVLALFYFIPRGGTSKSKPMQAEQAATAQAEQALYHHGPATVSTAPEPQRFSSPADTNLRHMADIVKNIATRLEDTPQCRLRPSALPDIMQQLQPYLEGARKDAAAWGHDFDYPRNAYTVLYNCCYDLLTGGHYHIYAGTIDPMGPGPNAQHIALACLDWLAGNGAITSEEKENDIEDLLAGIRAAG